MDEQEVKYLDMSVDEAVKFIISLGTVDDIGHKIKAKSSQKHKEKYMKPNKYRSVYAKDLTKDREGESVDLSGWVHRVRDHGGVIFIDLRDHTGLHSNCLQSRPKLTFFKQRSVVVLST